LVLNVLRTFRILVMRGGLDTRPHDFGQRKSVQAFDEQGVGDADVLPIRYMVLARVTPPAFDSAFDPSDLYSSDLAKQDGSFEDWNASKEGLHAGYYGQVSGEKSTADGPNDDCIDYRPDVAVGRWPVSSAHEVAILVGKTIQYETGLATRAAQGARRAALFSVGGWVDSRPQMDAAAPADGPPGGARNPTPRRASEGGIVRPRWRGRRV